MVDGTVVTIFLPKMFKIHSSTSSVKSKLFCRFASTLVLCEQKNGKLASSSLSAISAATNLPNKVVTALLLGAPADTKQSAASLANVQGVERVLTCSHDAFKNGGLADVLAPAIVKVIQSAEFSHVVGSHSAFIKNVVPRVAAMLDTALVSDVVKIVDGETFVRPIYAGNAISTVKVTDKIKLLTTRNSAFPPSAEKSTSEAKIEEFQYSVTPTEQSKWVKEEVAVSDRPELGGAKIVISGGRGLKNGDNFKLLYALADKCGAAVGASRAAVDAGFVPNDLQIGQTGKVVAPDLYMAVGISGAIQHLAGMKDSKVIVAINKDPEAPIFQVADYGLVADLFTALPELTKKL